MDHKRKLHQHIQAAANELLAYIRGCESSHLEGWVPAVQIKNALALNLVATPQKGIQYGPKGWLFAVLARVLEDQGTLEHRKAGSRSFFRSKAAA